MTEAPAVVPHCDFGFSNLHRQGDGRIAVIDCSPNGYTSWHVDSLEPAYFDLALMFSCLAGRLGFPGVAVRPHRSRHLARRFLDSYAAAADWCPDPDVLRWSAGVALSDYLVRRGLSRTLSSGVARNLVRWRL
jgi:hypothetical protein